MMFSEDPTINHEPAEWDVRTAGIALQLDLFLRARARVIMPGVVIRCHYAYVVIMPPKAT